LAQVPERVLAKGFVYLIIGHSKSNHVGAQATFKHLIVIQLILSSPFDDHHRVCFSRGRPRHRKREERLRLLKHLRLLRVDILGSLVLAPPLLSKYQQVGLTLRYTHFFIHLLCIYIYDKRSTGHTHTHTTAEQTTHTNTE